MPSESHPYGEGFTKNAILAIVYAGFVLQPMVIFSSLYGGLNLASSVQLITILLFSQIGLLLGRKLNKHEITVAYIASSISGAFTALPGFAIFMSYVRRNPAISISSLLPTWVVPPANSEALLQRTLLHIDWVPFFVVYCFSFTLWYLANFVLGLMAFQLYMEVEKLPFPYSRVSAETIITLSDEKTEKMRYFVYSLFIGFSYGLLTYAYPVLARAFLRYEVQPFIPVPWLDLNRLIQEYLSLHGGNLGIATSLSAIAGGFVIPFDIAIAGLLSSLIVNLVINPFLYRQGLLPSLLPGAEISYTWQRSFMDFWMGPSIGLVIALALVPLVFHTGNLREVFKSMKDLEKIYNTSRYMHFRFLMLEYVACSLGTVAITLFLCPDFLPYIWLLLLVSTLLPFILVFASARSTASGGISIEVPYIVETILWTLPYDKVDIWYAPFYAPRVTIGGPSAWWTDYLYIAKYTETKFTSVFKGWFLALPLAWGLGIIYMTAMWNLAPIPSSFYPYTAKTYPIIAANIDMFVSKRVVTLINPMLIIGGFLSGAIIYFVSSYFKHPAILAGVVGAVGGFIPLVVAPFIGVIIGKTIGPKLLGIEKWNKYKFVIAAGILGGEGLAAGFAGLVNVISNAMLTLPY